GEAASIPFAMNKELIEAAGKLKEGKDVLYAGISSNVLEESIALAAHSFDCGVDVVVATLPSYYSLSAPAMMKYMEVLAEKVSGPLIIYNIPSTTHMSIPLDVIDRLSYHPNIVGTKDSERNEQRLDQSIQLWKNRKDFSHFLGWAARSADAILAGSDGLVPSTGNFDPKLYAALYRAATEGKSDQAFALQKLSDVLGELYQQGRTLGESLWALKVLMKALGLCSSHVLPPIYEGSIEEEGKLSAALNQILNKEKIY
ncbi:MAG TPA: dihydrodipicolinate synthase family protein, partial [Flavisolibacter sp.]|nr:dihydrodipicolinate synthase family protein [Flavisolibacter sp.]